MTKDKFCGLVDKLLDVIDPMNSESRFIRVSTIWKHIIFKRQGYAQSYDLYWKEFNNAVMNYAYHHGTAAKQPEVRELLALICLFNSKIRPSDFNNILHDIIRTQKELNEKYDDVQEDFLTTPFSVRDTLNAIYGEEDMGEESLTENELKETKWINEIHNAISLISKERARLYSNEGDATGENVSYSNIPSEVKVALKSKLDAQLEGLRQVLSDMRKGMDANMDNASTSTKKARKEYSRFPLITLDSVRIVLLNLDDSEEAMRRRYQGNGNNQSTTLMGGPSTTKGKCWICEGDHFAREEPECYKKLLEKYERRRENMNDKEEEIQESRPTTKSGTTHIFHTRLVEKPTDTTPDQNGFEFSIISKLNENDTNYDKGSKTYSNEIIIDGGAGCTVAGIQQFVSYCDEHNLNPDINYLPRDKQEYHAFGTEDNYSKPERVIGHAYLSISDSQGRYIQIRVKIVDGDVPIIMGKSTLKQLDCIESHGKG